MALLINYVFTAKVATTINNLRILYTKEKEMNNNLIEPICVNFVTTNLCLIKQGPLKKWMEHSKFSISTQGENTTAVILHKLN